MGAGNRHPVDGAKGPPHRGVGYGLHEVVDKENLVPSAAFAFSPDSKRFAYIACDDPKKGVFVVAGDARSEVVEAAGGLVFNADGSKVAFWARPAGDASNEIWRNVLDYK